MEWRFLTDVILLEKKLKSPSWLLLALIEKREGNEDVWWKDGRGGRMMRENAEMVGVCGGEGTVFG